MTDYQNLLAAAVQAAEAAGAVLLKHQSDFSVLHDRGKDLKSAADLACEQTIFEILDATAIPVLSEETRQNAELLNAERVWIVDPLDGTVNYTRGLPLFCVSIGLWESGQPKLGVIHEPVRHVTWSGIVGEGATRNGVTMHTAQGSDPGQSVLSTGFPTGRSYDADDLSRFIESVRRFKKIRCIGSAALSLAYIADGTVDAYSEEDIWIWDVAAGIALVLAAGGAAEWSAWSSELKSRVVATNGKLSPREFDR